jgi:D-arginine dehydrogenase
MSRGFYDHPDPEFFPTPLLGKRGLLRVILRGGGAQHEATISGVPGIRTLTVAEAHDYFPLLDPKRILGASYEDDVHDIDVDALIRGCLRKARKHGAEILLGNPVVGIGRVKGGWSLATKAGTIQCATVVNATGGWANQTAQLAGLQLIGLTSCRRSMAVLPLPAALENRPLAPLTPADEEPVPPHDAFADDMTIAEGLHRFTEDTGFEVTRVTRTWAGLRSVAPDEYPVIGFDPAAPGFFWLAGQAGFGIQCAPGIARLAAGLIAGSSPDYALSEAFNVERMRPG